MTVFMKYKMLQYERIDISEGIDFDKTNKSVECMICHNLPILPNLPNILPNLPNLPNLPI